jgi:hypothetical protein
MRASARFGDSTPRARRSALIRASRGPCYRTAFGDWCIVSYVAGIWPQVSWLFFKARAKRRYLNHNGRASNTEKQSTGRGPEGCVENGPAAALLVGYLSIRYAPSSRLADAPILHATICQLHMRRCTSELGDEASHRWE